MEVLIVIVLAAAVIIAAVWWTRQKAERTRQCELDDAKAESRRWVERLGGQVLQLVGTTDAAQQALADAAERHTAATAQLEQATSAQQAKLTTDTALEGLYYVRAARTAMDMDPGPELPDTTGRTQAGRVTEYREVEVEGQQQVASPSPTEQTPHYYPGGRVAGRPVPEGWYSEPWWKPALAAGAWGVGSVMLMSTLFGGMSGVPAAAAVDGGGDFGGDLDGDPGEHGLGDAGADDPGIDGMDDGGGLFDGFDFDF